jgi:uncharacterized membrane protein YeaQ/YmgE (transglycosylase-associated protein family)
VPVALAIFALLFAIFVILPLVGYALWFVLTIAFTGIVVGALGRLIVPGRQPIGVLATIACGWVGALAGGVVAHAAGLGWFTKVLIEIGLSAGAVAVWSGTHRRPVAGGRSHGVIDV